VGYDAEHLVVGTNALVKYTASIHRVEVKEDASSSSETSFGYYLLCRYGPCEYENIKFCV
jgi:hypothetical protein